MKKQDIEKLVSELREFAETERILSDYSRKENNLKATHHDFSAYKFSTTADALERILKEGIE
jgi:hypothetical protein